MNERELIGLKFSGTRKTLSIEKKLGDSFLRGDFSREGGGTLPQNSYNPYQDLPEATL